MIFKVFVVGSVIGYTLAALRNTNVCDCFCILVRALKFLISFKIQCTCSYDHLIADTWETTSRKNPENWTHFHITQKSGKFINTMYSFDISSINDSDISLDFIYKVTLKN